MTDLNADCEQLPLTPPIEDWFGHKGLIQTSIIFCTYICTRIFSSVLFILGMVQAAEYILKKLQREQLIEQALNSDPERSTDSYKLVLVGHSLGAGTAAILAILLRPQFPDLRCYSYSPPGGLLRLNSVKFNFYN